MRFLSFLKSEINYDMMSIHKSCLTVTRPRFIKCCYMTLKIDKINITSNCFLKSYIWNFLKNIFFTSPLGLKLCHIKRPTFLRFSISYHFGGAGWMSTYCCCYLIIPSIRESYIASSCCGTYDFSIYIWASELIIIEAYVLEQAHV